MRRHRCSTSSRIATASAWWPSFCRTAAYRQRILRVNISLAPNTSWNGALWTIIGKLGFLQNTPTRRGRGVPERWCSSRPTRRGRGRVLRRVPILCASANSRAHDLVKTSFIPKPATISPCNFTMDHNAIICFMTDRLARGPDQDVHVPSVGSQKYPSRGVDVIYL